MLLLAFTGCATPHKTMTTTTTEKLVINEKVFNNSFDVFGQGKRLEFDSLTIITFDTIIERQSAERQSVSRQIVDEKITTDGVTVAKKPTVEKAPPKQDTLSVRYSPATNEFSVSFRAASDTTADTTRIITTETEVVKQEKSKSLSDKLAEIAFVLMLVIVVGLTLRK